MADQDRIAEIQARVDASSCGVFMLPEDAEPGDIYAILTGLEPDEDGVRLTAADLTMLGNATSDLRCLLREVARLRGLVERMLPLVQHSDGADHCPMAFHRSDGERCTCGALEVVREARAVLGEAPQVPVEARNG